MDDPPQPFDINYGEWRLASYHESLTDIRWAKERMADIVHWAVLLLAALVAISDSVPRLSRQLLAAFAILLIGTALWWLLDLSLFARRSRNRVDKLLVDAPEVVRPHRPRDKHHVMPLVVQCLVVLSAGLLSLCALLQD